LTFKLLKPLIGCSIYFLKFKTKTMTMFVKKWRQKIMYMIICIIAICSFSSNSYAAHFRSGTISWRVVSGNTIEFKVSQSYGGWAFGGGYTLGSVQYMDNLLFGNGNYAPINLTITSINAAEGWWYGESTITYTYPTSGNYTAYFSSCCRISNLSNNANQNWRNETIVNVGGNNNSPVTTVPATINLPAGISAAAYQIPGFDPDGDALTYSLATSAEMGGGLNPSGLSINSTTGLMSFNTIGRPIGSLWNVAITIRDGKTKVTVDFIIKITQSSTPPYFDYLVTPSNGQVFQISPGQNINFIVRSKDNDPGSTVSTSAVGLPPFSSTNPALPTNGNPSQSTFSWTPTANQFGTYVINFTATDDVGVQASTSVTIVVSLKPVFNVPPTPASGSQTYLETNIANSTTITASDPDPNDVVQIISVVGLPSGASLSATLPTTAGNPTSLNLLWTPTPSNFGIHNVSFTAKDSYGDQANHSFKYLVNTKPSFTSTPITQAYVGQLYQYNITGIDPDVQYGDVLNLIGANIPSWLTFTNNGNGIGTLSGTPTLADLGSYNVSLILEDTYHHDYNPHVDQDFVINVAGIAPQIACPANITVNNTAGQCGANVTFAATETTAIPASTITYSHAPGSFFPVGTTTITATATNAVGTSSCTFTVTVVDNELPTVIAPAGKTLECSDGQDTRYLKINSSPNSSYNGITVPVGYSLFGAQPHSVPITSDVVLAEDGIGNTNDICEPITNNVNGKIAVIFRGTCFFTYKVMEAQNAGAIGVIIINNQPGNNVVNMGGTNPNITIPSVMISNNDGNILLSEMQNGSVNISIQNPELIIGDNCSNNLKVYRTNNFIPGNCPNTFQEVITWTAVDAAGNTQTATTIDFRQDTKAPILQNVPTAVTVSCEAVPAAANVTATDNCSTPIVNLTETSTQHADVNNAGHYNYTITRIWTATDACGNSSSASQTITVEDKTAPVANCKPVTVTLVGGVASITSSDVNNGSTDNCNSPLSYSLSNTSFTCNNIGLNTVTLTVTDVSGNSSTCTAEVTVVGEIPTCSITSVPTNIAFTGGVSTNLYLGYGAQSTTLQVSAAASGAPYTYQWSGPAGLSSTTSGSPVFTATAEGTYTFTVLVTNKYGCTTTCSITICVLDIRAKDKKGNYNGKVYVCHVPPGNPGNAHTLEISVNAVPAHVGLHGGDRLGKCEQQICSNTTNTQYVDLDNNVLDKSTEDLSIKVSPNPSSNYFVIRIDSKQEGKIQVRVITASGQPIERKDGIQPGSSITLGSSWLGGRYYLEAIQGDKKKVVSLIKMN
jgi:hypothetical protein